MLICLYSVYFFALVFLISMVWTHFKGAPWVPSGRRNVERMLKMAKVRSNDIVYDLGCGDGRILFTAVRDYNARAVGIEIDPLRSFLLKIWVRIRGLSGKIQIRTGNFFNHDLSGANVVTCYLLPKTNRLLEKKLMKELKPGTRVVSNAFSFPNMKLIEKDRKRTIYLYEI